MPSPEAGTLVEVDFPFGHETTPLAYGVDCEDRLVDRVAEVVPPGLVVVVADRNVAGVANRVRNLLAARGRRSALLTVDATESAKSLATVDELARRALAAGMSRSSSVVSVGGGLVENLAGMLAGLAFRGVPIVHLPTTPVGAFDAVLSRKQAVSLDGVKNALGLFRTPTFVGVDLRWLETVDRTLLMTGLAEMAKNVVAVVPEDAGRFVAAVEGLDADPSGSLMTLLDIGIRAKAPFLAADPDEKGVALVFEYGHTVGHAIETSAVTPRPHGESVGWGMLVAADVARVMTGLNVDAYALHDELLRPLGVVRNAPPDLDVAVVVERALRDNKRGYRPLAEDEVGMVLLADAGRVAGETSVPIVPVPADLVRRCLAQLMEER
ncbi:3-dehydroquinate synthase family protein [Xylanimonas oleitrophica]|nr:iron-containing alcohol dehydrogenase [Xylanimonas oleitrophica]